MGVIGGYRERALSAVKWSVSGDLAEQSIRLLFGVALARLLSPRDFGLIAMVTAITQIVGALAELGLADAIVQRRELTEAHRSSVFWVLLLAGGVLGAAQVAGATAIASFCGAQELTALAVILSLLFVLDAIGWVPRAILARRLEFRAVAWLQCAVATLASTSAVILAVRGFGVKSLAADLLLTSALESLLLLIASRWRPRLEFHVAALRDLFGFSANRFLARVLGFSAGPIDQLLIGALTGSSALGLYVRAFNLTRLPITNVSRSIVRAMFPSLALIQHDTVRTRDVYLRALPAVALATCPMCLGFLATAEPLVVGVLGPQWRGTVPLLRILSVAGLVQSVSVLATSVYLSQGRTDLQFRLAGLERLSTIAALVIGLQWGTLGAATAYVFTAVLNALPMLYFAGRLIELDQRAVFARVSPVLVAGVVMTAIVVGIDVWVLSRVDLLARLVLEVAVGIFSYWGALRLLRVPAYADVMSILQRAA